MAERIGNTLVIAPTKPAPCELCGAMEELRPYGPNGENICHGCANKDPEGTHARMVAVLEKQLVGATTLIGPHGEIVRRGQAIEDSITLRPKN